MKLAVFSDSHGMPDCMLAAVEQIKPDVLVHLGDGERDVPLLKERFPGIPLHAVCGNCDFSSVRPETELFEIEGVKIFITHGHLFDVKSTRAKLLEEAARRGASIAMFGHTHVSQLVQTDGFTLLNPGGCGPSANPSCAVVTIENGKVEAEILKLL